MTTAKASPSKAADEFAAGSMMSIKFKMDGPIVAGKASSARDGELNLSRGDTVEFQVVTAEFSKEFEDELKGRLGNVLGDAEISHLVRLSILKVLRDNVVV